MRGIWGENLREMQFGNAGVWGAGVCAAAPMQISRMSPPAGRRVWAACLGIEHAVACMGVGGVCAGVRCGRGRRCGAWRWDCDVQ